MSESLVLNSLGVTWHCQTPSSNSKLALKILREQSPGSALEAAATHSYFPGWIPTGLPSLSHRHSPRLFNTTQDITTWPPGFTSWYLGCCAQACGLPAALAIVSRTAATITTNAKLFISFVSCFFLSKEKGKNTVRLLRKKSLNRLKLSCYIFAVGLFKGVHAHARWGEDGEGNGEMRNDSPSSL